MTTPDLAEPARVVGYAGDTLDRLTRVVPDFPMPGVLFRDLTPVLADPDGLHAVIEGLATAATAGGVEVIAGLEARGFLLSAALAQRLGTGVLAIRKAGKLPGRLVSQEYSLEYGVAALEVNPDDVRPGIRVLLVDDVLATGGTAAAGRDLLQQCGAVVAGLAVAIELDALVGRSKLADLPVTALRHY
jgi:adenine phosphoribosyltransferase